mmetsp:Transcript_60215/g.175969  ORF Transcript_60215/g.175969 Transcript_60215/m.175969 type:complete len:212 (+) Transcript_60215:901-1536(+)
MISAWSSITPAGGTASRHGEGEGSALARHLPTDRGSCVVVSPVPVAAVDEDAGGRGVEVMAAAAAGSAAAGAIAADRDGGFRPVARPTSTFPSSGAEDRARLSPTSVESARQMGTTAGWLLVCHSCLMAAWSSRVSRCNVSRGMQKMVQPRRPRIRHFSARSRPYLSIAAGTACWETSDGPAWMDASGMDVSSMQHCRSRTQASTLIPRRE